MYEILPKLTQDPAHGIPIPITLKFLGVFLVQISKDRKMFFFSEK